MGPVCALSVLSGAGEELAVSQVARQRRRRAVDPPRAIRAMSMLDASQEDVPPVMLETLGDDLLHTILSHTRFSALISLYQVSHGFAAHSRSLLNSDPRLQTPRMLLRLRVVKPAGTRLCENKKSLNFIQALLRDDVFLVEALACVYSGLPLGVSAIDLPADLGGRVDHRRLCVPASHVQSGWVEVPAEASPLHLASSVEMVALLIDEYRMPVDATRANGCTALMDACAVGDAAIVKALCARGADVNKRCASGDSVLRYADTKLAGVASRAWRGSSLAPQDHEACDRILREYGARQGRFTRSEWFTSEDLDGLPDEYVPAFH